MDQDKNVNWNSNLEQEGNSLKGYIKLIRANLAPIILITITALAVSVLYAVKARDIYKSTAVLKISKPEAGGILEAPLLQGYSDFGNDRFLANELEILSSWTLREKVANTLLDTIKVFNDPERFYLLIDHSFDFEDSGTLTYLDTVDIIEMLEKKVDLNQKRGIDFVEISVESPSPFEAALIANVYANEYRKLNLAINRQQLVAVKEFLRKQRDEKRKELILTEERLRQYQEAGGLVALPEHASALIQQLTDFEAKKNAASIDLQISEQSLTQLKEELSTKDPKLKDYLESLAVQPYIKSLQEQLAVYQTKKDLAIASTKVPAGQNQAVKKLDKQIADIKAKLNKEIEKLGAGALAYSPEEIKELTQKVFEAEVQYQAQKAKYNQLSRIVSEYNKKFNELPTKTLDLARYEREQKSYEKLYLAIEEKYQEALINEQSTPGDVLIVDKGRIPFKPSKPNRILIVIVGLVLGLGLGFGYAFTKNYFDTTIKTPEDIQKKNINVLTWIPHIEAASGNKEFEFIVAKKPDSIPSESFRALRTRIQFSKIERDAIKTILVTSSTPKEGKTTVSVNLAGSFAQANKRTIIIDCDLRKPRMHNVFDDQRFPGFTDFFFGQASFEEVLRKSDLSYLYYITAGTIPPNPSEILGSVQMEKFLARLKNEFDIVILDSPPVIAVTDSEILSSLVDATLLVVSAEQTEGELMEKAAELLAHQHGSFLGTVLNNFSYRSGYGSYYKYYYYYSKPANGSKKKNKKEKTTV